MVAVQLMIVLLISSMTIILKWYFESVFIQKRLCWPSFWNYYLFEIRSAQSAKTVFYVLRFEMIYDCHFEMSKAFLFSFWNALWLSFWNEGGKIFVHRIIFVRRIWNILMTKILYYYYFLTQIFTQCQRPYTCVEIHFIMKGGICNVRF